MKAKKPEALDLEPPGCLTDGSNDQIPREYISKWRVTDNNREQRFKELVYVINFLKLKGMSELVANPKLYERDFYLLCKGMFKSSNVKFANQRLLLKTLLDNGITELLKEYWKEMISEFELKRKEADENLTAGQLWAFYTEHQKHIVDALANSYNIFLIFWHGSDIKDDDSLKLIYEGLIDFLLQALDTYLHPLEVDSSHPQHKVIKACLGTVHNLCNKYGDCISDLRQKDALQIVAKFRASGTSTLKTKSILSCSYLLTEKDNTNMSVIELDESDIGFLTKVLRDSLDSPNTVSKKYGYHADEVISGLNNIAVVESNKKILVDAGVLPLYVEALGKSKLDLKESAVHGIWTLAFDAESKQRIMDEPGCMEDLRKLSESDVPSLKSAADGALWQIEGESKHIRKLTNVHKPAAKNLPHIMMSYQWDSKTEVMKLRERLKTEGYRVWIDVEQMSGSTLQAMAKAVERSTIFVPVLTEKYKASPACRQEAEYAHLLHKKLVPVRLQPKYRPDGWLGFLIGSTFFYDLTRKEQYESKVQDFIKAIGEDGKIKPGEDVNPIQDDDDIDGDEAVGQTSSHTGNADHPQPHTLPTHEVLNTMMKPTFDINSLRCLSWSCKQVNEWLAIHRLQKYSEKLMGVDGDGTLLAELAYMRFTSPDVYYDLMRTDNCMSALDLLRLNAAIRKLAAVQ